MASQSGITVDIAAVSRMLKSLLQKIGQRQQANRQVSIQMQAFVFRNFQSEGKLVGGWASLAQSTIAWKRRHGYARMLQNTGETRNSFTGFYSNDNAGVGSPLARARWLHEGTGRMPARALLPDRKQVQEIGMKVYEDFIARRIKEAR